MMESNEMHLSECNTDYKKQIKELKNLNRVANEQAMRALERAEIAEAKNHDLQTKNSLWKESFERIDKAYDETNAELDKIQQAVDCAKKRQGSRPPLDDRLASIVIWILKGEGE